MRRQARIGLCALSVVAAVPVALISGCGGDEDTGGETNRPRAQTVVDGIEGPVERLQDALVQASPQSRSSMIALRAAAERAADEVDDAASEVRNLRAQGDAEEDAVLGDVENALDELSELATVLSARTPSVARIEEAAAQAELVAEDLDVVRLPRLDVRDFVAALRRERRPVSPAPSTGASGGPGGAIFNTGRDPGQSTAAAFCRAVPAELRCWTPNDGFTLVLDENGARRDRAAEPSNRGYEPSSEKLVAGQTWQRHGFVCESTIRALTCSNAGGSGFTLPRYRGLPSYF